MKDETIQYGLLLINGCFILKFFGTDLLPYFSIYTGVQIIWALSIILYLIVEITMLWVKIKCSRQRFSS